MENVAIKLNHLVEEFHYFEDNQVLTATHLNSVIDFLDRRDRLTRTKLIGTGIVCGLDVSLNEKTITVSKGAAITSDGDLIHIDEATNFSQFKKFDDKRAKYQPFQKEDAQASFELWQLFPKDAKENGLTPIEKFTNRNRKIGNMVLVLYLNSYLEPPEDCTEVDCDNQGMKQRAQLIPLLIAKSDLDRIRGKSQNTFFNLPDVHIQRVNFHNKVITHEENLLERFRNAIQVSSESLISGLKVAGGGRDDDFIQHLIAPLYNKRPVDNWVSKLSSTFKNININDRPDVLYIYNFMKDLAQAYTEFKEAIFDISVECCPNPSKHPKHVMARELVAENSNLPAAYRHHFCESPILNHKDKNVKKAQQLHLRIDTMIDGFKIPNNNSFKLKITPSKNGDYTLDQKSIPYYYAFKSRKPYLNQFWSFEKTVRNQSSGILGFWADKYSESDQARNPLNFNIEEYNFYRIEGHLGQPVNEVEKNLEKLKKEFNLSFNIVTVQIEDEIKTVRPPRLKFPALDVLLHHYREDLNANMSVVGKFNNELTTKATEAEASNDFKENEAALAKLKIAKTEVATLNTKTEQVNNLMYAKLGTFDKNFTSFKSNYNEAVDLGYKINEKVYPLTQTKNETPLHRFVLDNQFKRFDRLVDLFRKKKEKVIQQYIFDKFYNQNTGLEHLSGVPKGGTFVLVYVSAEDEKKQRIVADFCLPGCCVIEIEPEVEPTPPPKVEVDPPIGVFRPPTINFIDKFDVFKFPETKNLLTAQLDLSSKFQLVEQNIGTITTDVSWLRGISVGTRPVGPVIDTPGGITNPGGRVFENPALGLMSENMSRTGEMIRILEAKENPSNEDKATLVALSTNFDTMASSMLGMMAAKGSDVDATGDEAKALEIIRKESESFSKKVKLTNTTKKVKEIKRSAANKPVMKDILSRFKIG